MGKRRRRGTLTRSLSKVRKEATGTITSALGLVPGVGTVLSIFNTTTGAVKTAKAVRKAGKSLKGKARRRPRRSRKR
jgi:hypothetical protein